MASITTAGGEANDVAWIAFADHQCVAFGAPRDVVTALKARVDAESDALILAFDARSSSPVELDLRGSLADALARLPAELVPASETDGGVADRARDSTADLDQPVARSPGRPKLGVTAREVTLLPRHWDWLAKQSGGASVALRKLVEQAVRANAEADRLREKRESAYRFMTAVAGNAPGHEEAVRALFAGDGEKLRSTVAQWPNDVRAHVLRLVGED